MRTEHQASKRNSKIKKKRREGSEKIKRKKLKKIKKGVDFFRNK